MDIRQDEALMRIALNEAHAAYVSGEVPVGAVIARGGDIVAYGHNRREAGQSALSHAEMEAIAEACRVLGRWRLSDCTLYVTLEPCPMCAGAILNARVGRVVFGASDRAMGACGSVADLFAMPFGWEPVVRSGVLESECAALLSGFFKEMRSGKG